MNILFGRTGSEYIVSYNEGIPCIPTEQCSEESEIFKTSIIPNGTILIWMGTKTLGVGTTFNIFKVSTKEKNVSVYVSTNLNKNLLPFRKKQLRRR